MKLDLENPLSLQAEQRQLPPKKIEPEVVKISRQVRRHRERKKVRTFKAKVKKQVRVDKILRRLGIKWKVKFLTKKEYEELKYR